MSFKMKTIVGVAAIEAVFLMLLVWQAMHILTISNQQSLEARAQETVGLFGTQIENALIATDLATLNEMVNQLVHQGRVAYVRVLDKRGVLASAGVPAGNDWSYQRDDNFDDIRDGMFDTDYQVIETGIYLGTVQLGISTAGLDFLIIESRVRLVGIALAELIMVALVSWMLGCYLTRTLSRLTQQARCLSRGEAVKPLPVSGNDELAVTAQAFNEMVNKLSQARDIDAIKSAIYDASLDAMITLDQQGNIIEFSSAAESILGWKRDEIIGKKVEEALIPEELVASHLARRNALMNERQFYGQEARREAVMLTRQGTRIPIEVSSVVFNSQDKTYFTVFFRDITEQKNNQAQLVAAKEAAENASQAKSRFLSHMSHEIRSPLNAVMGALQLLSSDTLSVNQRRLMAIADTAGGSLLSVINDILDFSRIESGNLQTVYDTIELDDTINRLLTTLGNKLKDDNVELLCQIDDTVPSTAEFDVVHTMQVIRNLMDNAIKFTDKGLICLRIDFIADAGQQPCLAISITDTGRGIPPSQLEQVFQEFEQVNAREDTKAGGAGLGLAIVKRLVDWMGGTLDVSSTYGQGCVFRFTVPLRSYSESITEVMPIRYQTIALVSANQALLQAFGDYLGLMDVSLQTFDSLADFKANGQAIQQNKDAILLIDEIELLAADADFYWYRCLAMPKVRLARLGNNRDAIPTANNETTLYKPLSCKNIKQLICGQKDGKPAAIDYSIKPVNNNRILIVEDVGVNQAVLREILTKAGYVVDSAENGAQALQMLVAQPYDAVLMDVHMPVMNGIDAVIQLRASTGLNQHVPVIALTANAEKSEMERCLNAGMNDFISKPFFATNLLTAIGRQIDKEAAHAKQAALSQGSKNPTDQRPNANELLNEAALRKLVAETSEQALPKMLDSFIAELARRVGDLEDAVEHENTQELGGQAHALKSSSALFGALAVQQAAQQLEQMCQVDSPVLTDVTKQAQELILLVSQTLERYRAYTQSMAAEQREHE